jgi:6-phosphogluconolactonase
VTPVSFRTIVEPDATALARAVARRIAELSREEAEPVAVALSGGSTPARLYEILADAPLRDEVAWSRLELFFGDERSVPADHPDSNYGMAARLLFSKVPAKVHRMAAERGAAEEYERTIRERVRKRRGALPSFDLILLGMGDDGHTASLFPGTAALAERQRLVVMNDVPQKGTIRMTFTYPLLNAAERVWLLVAGADKRAVVARCRAARSRGERPYPVLGVEPTGGELVWWLDRAANGEAGPKP